MRDHRWTGMNLRLITQRRQRTDMDVETILEFLEQNDRLISTKYGDSEDWVAGYKYALSQMREFISGGAASRGEAKESTTVDLLNDIPFLEIMHRALNLCAVAQAVLSRLPMDDADALGDAASQFRNWFAGKGI